MAWVRPAYHRDVWPDGDDRRLINLDHYRIVRVTYGAFGPQGRAGWSGEAITETMDRSASTSEIQGRTALLAVVPTEEEAVALFERVQQELASGGRLLDLRPAPPDGASGRDQQ
jgi:hypothetical protein